MIDLKIGKWYKNLNQIFIPIKKLDSVYTMFTILVANHLKLIEMKLYEWESREREGRIFLYQDDSQDTIKKENITTPDQSDFNSVFRALFEYKHDFDVTTVKQTIREIKNSLEV